MKASKTLGWWQWETLLVTMGGYALYYVIRKNLSIAMPLLGEIGVSKVQLGAFLTAGGNYGIICIPLPEGRVKERVSVWNRSVILE